MLYESSYLSEMEWKTYSYWFDTFKNKTELDLILYVNTEPDECYNRIIKRNRPEEVNKISKEYLIMCHNKHLQWFNDSENKTKIIHINGHKSVDDVMDFVKQITEQLISEKQN
jgi:deoxyadenosine/deoxycytidine kinase